MSRGRKDIVTEEQMVGMSTDGLYIFTFALNQPYGGHCQPIYAADANDARRTMNELYGEHWAFQYTGTTWFEYLEDPNRWWDMEIMLRPVYTREWRSAEASQLRDSGRCICIDIRRETMLKFELEVFDGSKTETYHVVRSVEDQCIEEDILEQSPYEFINPSIGYGYKVSVTKLESGELYMHRSTVEPYQWMFDSIINYGRIITPRAQELERLNKPAKKPIG